MGLGYNIIPTNLSHEEISFNVIQGFTSTANLAATVTGVVRGSGLSERENKWPFPWKTPLHLCSLLSGQRNTKFTSSTHATSPK